MARDAITRTPLPATGIDLTDGDLYETLATGDGNGVEFPFNKNDLLILSNGTANPATYSLEVAQPDNYVAKGIEIPAAEVDVAAGKVWAYPLSAIFQQPSGLMYVDCDEAADILVLSP